MLWSSGKAAILHSDTTPLKGPAFVAGAGPFAFPACRILSMTSKIPKIFHALWGGPPMPTHLAAYIEVGRSLQHDRAVHQWTPDSLPTLRNEDLSDRPERYSPVSNPWQWRSDRARYELLYDIGGLYIDAGPA